MRKKKGRAKTISHPSSIPTIPKADPHPGTGKLKATAHFTEVDELTDLTYYPNLNLKPIPDPAIVCSRVGLWAGEVQPRTPESRVGTVYGASGGSLVLIGPL